MGTEFMDSFTVTVDQKCVDSGLKFHSTPNRGAPTYSPLGLALQLKFSQSQYRVSFYYDWITIRLESESGESSDYRVDDETKEMLARLLRGNGNTVEPWDAVLTKCATPYKTDGDLCSIEPAPLVLKQPENLTVDCVKLSCFKCGLKRTVPFDSDDGAVRIELPVGVCSCGCSQWQLVYEWISK